MIFFLFLVYSSFLNFLLAEFIQTACLCGITSFFNPLNSSNRINNFNTFSKKINEQKIFLITVELYYEQTHILKDYIDLYHGINIDKEDFLEPLWQKERLLNIGLSLVNSNKLSCENIVFLDADILFKNNDWTNNICEGLKNYTALQPFTKVHRLSLEETKQNATLQTSLDKAIFKKRNRYHDVHPGLIWAVKKELILKTKIYDKAIVGGGDTLLSAALMYNHSYLSKKVKEIGSVSSASKLQHDFLIWALKVYPLFKGKIGVIDDEIYHLWHGDSMNRQYGSRHRILVHGKYNPNEDVLISPKGYLKWNSSMMNLGRKRLMKQRIINFFNLRKDDG